jgi:hypothetical protein
MRVLVVSGETALRAAVVRLLQPAGHFVELATSEKRARELIGGGAFGAAIIAPRTAEKSSLLTPIRHGCQPLRYLVLGLRLEMRRRQFIELIAGAAAAVALPATGGAQQTVPVVGFMHSRGPDDAGHIAAGFRRGLRSNTVGRTANTAASPR